MPSYLSEILLNLANVLSANANAIPAATWFLLELLFDPALEARIHKEFSSALIQPTDPSHVPVFDINKLCSGPLCQSVYAETLRLRVQVMVQRTAVQDIDFCRWAIKKGEKISICSANEALDERVWNTGSESDPHPLDEFWADRFLIYPNDPTSGPLKPREAAEIPEKVDERGTPRFSLEGLGTNWIPFSGAPRLCPGRHFAKQEMISGTAIMLAAFEIELMTRKKPENDKTYFGFGTLPPKGKITCRIRRRRRSTMG
jgi:cytochrome P450